VAFPHAAPRGGDTCGTTAAVLVGALPPTSPSNVALGYQLVNNKRQREKYDVVVPVAEDGRFDKTFGATGRDYGQVHGETRLKDISKRRSDRWNFLFIAGMCFQDLFNYDFRRTEQCIIPYATQQGEISFCAYNTGIGWRNIVEKMHMTATLTKWYEEHGRHEIFAGGKAVPLSSVEHSLRLNEEHVRMGAQIDLDKLGIAKNAREEKLRAREARQRQEEENRRMAKLYRQVVLKEPEREPLVQIH
jgi:hypothetical protein